MKYIVSAFKYDINQLKYFARPTVAELLWNFSLRCIIIESCLLSDWIMLRLLQWMTSNKHVDVYYLMYNARMS